MEAENVWIRFLFNHFLGSCSCPAWGKRQIYRLAAAFKILKSGKHSKVSFCSFLPKQAHNPTANYFYTLSRSCVWFQAFGGPPTIQDELWQRQRQRLFPPCPFHPASSDQPQPAYVWPTVADTGLDHWPHSCLCKTKGLFSLLFQRRYGHRLFLMSSLYQISFMG